MKRQNRITYEPELCSGCMYCMTSCSTYNSGITDLSHSRIRITRHEGFAITGMDQEDDLVFNAILCRQCGEPACADVCPEDAIARDSRAGAWIIDHEKCIQCMECMGACPYGAILYDPVKKGPFKCELCDGDPWCVRMCAGHALKFVPCD